MSKKSAFDVCFKYIKTVASYVVLNKNNFHHILKYFDFITEFLKKKIKI